MSGKKHIILLAALGMTFATSAHAAGVITNTLFTTGDLGVGLNNTPAAESFISDGTGIGDVELYLGEALATTTGSVAITIRSDNTNRPSGTIVDTVATLNESQIPTSQTLFDFYNLPINNLTPDTKYWVEIAKATGSSQISTNTYTTAPGNITTGTPSSGTSAGDTNYSLNGATGTFNTKLMTVCVSDDNSCDASNVAAVADSFNETVPEPASLGLLGTFLVALGFMVRRRARA